MHIIIMLEYIRKNVRIKLYYYSVLFEKQKKKIIIIRRFFVLRVIHYWQEVFNWKKKIWDFYGIRLRINYEKNNEIIRNLQKQVFNPIKIILFFFLFVLILQTRNGVDERYV